jgi:hypothetical protein
MRDWTLAVLVLLLLIALMASGCTTTAEQLKQLQGENAAIGCIVANTPYGKGNGAFISATISDKIRSELPAGASITIDDACKITISSGVPPTVGVGLQVTPIPTPSR